jgi:hypothetical protein
MNYCNVLLKHCCQLSHKNNFMRWLIYSILTCLLFIILFACAKEKSCENCLAKEGRVSFYTLTGCVNLRAPKLIINNREYTIEPANFSVPVCSSSGTITISLPAGTYRYEKVCGFPSAITTGEVTVRENTCVLIEL